MAPGEIYHKRILFAVLNWGLGHATRSAVLIEQLIGQHNQVTLFSSGQALCYLQERFPQLTCYDMQAREMYYPAHRHLWLKLLLQQKKIYGNIETEHQTAGTFCAQLQPDLLISDNCYGFYSNKIPSVFITHQVHIQAPFFERTAQKKIHRLLRPFVVIWIPDFAGDENLSGRLSRPVLPSLPFEYIGPLSSLQKNASAQIQYAFCAIVSGPEKQRSLFEKSAMDFLAAQHQPAVLVRGTGTARTNTAVPAHITVVDLCTRGQLSAFIDQSHTIIGRTGYSTLMDMYHLQKPCMLLPTPGQTEQEYLFAKHFGHARAALSTLAARKILPNKN